jgi:prevent-host-death family protein
MQEVSVSDLRNHLPEYLARVESGEAIWITRRGRVVARIDAVTDPRAEAKRRLAALRSVARVGDVVTPLDAAWEASP